MPKQNEPKVTIEESTVRVCGECDGEKSANGKTPCPVCNGTGEVT